MPALIPMENALLCGYCKDCRYGPKQPTDENACPFTAPHWDFRARRRKRLKPHARMGRQFKNLDRKSKAERID